MRRAGGRRAPSRPGALPPPPRAGPRCPRAPGGAKAKFPGVSPASGMRGGGGRLTCAHAATGERRRLTWRPDGRRGVGGGGPGAPRADVWAPAAPVSHTFQIPVDGARGQQVCYSPSDGGPEGDCCSLRIAGADSRTRASGPHRGTAQRRLASSSALRVSLACRRPRRCWPRRSCLRTNRMFLPCRTRERFTSTSPSACWLAKEMVHLGLESGAGS